MIDDLEDARRVEPPYVMDERPMLASYAAYDAAPLDTEDAWGDLASFRDAASAS